MLFGIAGHRFQQQGIQSTEQARLLVSDMTHVMGGLVFVLDLLLQATDHCPQRRMMSLLVLHDKSDEQFYDRVAAAFGHSLAGRQVGCFGIRVSLESADQTFRHRWRLGRRDRNQPGLRNYLKPVRR